MLNLIPWRKTKDSGLPAVPGSDNSLTRLRGEFEALFDRFWREWPVPFDSAFSRGAFWGFDVEDRGNEVVVTAEAPGFEPDDFECEISGNLFTIKAEKRSERGAGGNGQNQARSYASFRRSTTLPPGIAPDKVEAKYRHGVLEVHVPKTEQGRPKRIQVKA
jgi:HSP20 family protein